MADRRSVYVLVYVRDPARVLLLRRPEARAAGWQCVTGGVEPADADAAFGHLLVGPPATPEVPTLVSAAVREIGEETSLPPPLEVVDLVDERSFLGYDGHTYRQRSFAARYAAALPVEATPEHEEARWVEPREAYALVRWESDRYALRMLFGDHVDSKSPP